jgi:hypothetical protein
VLVVDGVVILKTILSVWDLLVRLEVLQLKLILAVCSVSSHVLE